MGRWIGGGDHSEIGDSTLFTSEQTQENIVPSRLFLHYT